jgi:sterol desaturase/sphingolipid hydroxylase (fatty acid hydroxylase superfamily)
MRSLLTRWEFVSPFLVTVTALVLMALERWRPYNREQRYFREGFWNDLVLYTFVQSYILGLVIKALALGLDHRTGLSRLHLVSEWPVVVQLLFFFVTHDLYIYTFHRLQHRFPLLWRIHEAHHATQAVDWLSGSRSHPLEILINQSIEFIPIVVLGAHPDVWLMKTALDAVWGMYIHSNVDVRSGRLQWIVNGPEMHRWHHAVELVDGRNFATKLAVWDWLFGTAYLPEHKAKGYGVWGDRVPSGYLAQVARAFRLPDRASAGRTGATTRTESAA